MSERRLLSIVESASHPDFSRLYQRLGFEVTREASIRKAQARLKRLKPDFVVAEFFYGYGNNYSGTNVSNLDVLLFSLQKYAPEAKVIALVDKTEHQYVARLEEKVPLYAVLQLPVDEQAIEPLLTA